MVLNDSNIGFLSTPYTTTYYSIHKSDDYQAYRGESNTRIRSIIFELELKGRVFERTVENL